MKYVLIDTNCFAVDLLSSDGENYLLDTLEHWSLNRYITLLVPDLIRTEEWPRVRETYIKEFGTYSENVRKPFQNQLSPLDTLIDLQALNFKHKANRITSLINAGASYEPSQTVKAEMSDRQLKKLAPFHNKQRSLQDAIIYFSTIEYLRLNAINEFYFITRNYKDFGNPDISYELHSDLKVEGINVRIFVELGHAIDRLIEEEKLPKALKIKSSELNSEYPAQLLIARETTTHSIIDELYFSMEKYNDQIPFIPTQILSRTHPFKILTEGNSYTRITSFKLYTNNDKLVKLLESVDITEGSIKSIDNLYFKETEIADKKLYSALKKLTGNLVYEVSHLGRGASKVIRIEEMRQCECVKCCFERLEFVKALNLIQQEYTSLSEKTKQAFIQYRFGSALLAFQTYYSIYKSAIELGKHILSFICLYNLKKLCRMIKSVHLDKVTSVTLKITEVERIRLDHEILKATYHDPFVSECIKWIKNETFYYEATIEISSLVAKIREHYNLQLDGGWSSNSNLVSLLSQFAEFDLFLERNCIVFSHFSEFKKVFEIFLEGLLMSHQMSEKQSSRLVAFDDYLFSKIILYAEPAFLLKQLKHFNISSLRYKEGSSGNKSIVEIITGLIDDAVIIHERISSLSEERGIFFLSELKTFLLNSFVVLSYSSIQEGRIRSVADSLLVLLRNGKVLNKTEHRYLALFIAKKGKYFCSKTVKELIQLAVDESWLHEAEIFEALAYQVSKYHKDCIISDNKLFRKIAERFYEEYLRNEEYVDTDILLAVYDMMSNRFKNKISELIYANLDDSFSKKTYYIFSIHGIIDFNRYFAKYINQIEVNPTQSSHVGFFGERAVIFPELSQLINLCFKNDVNLAMKKFQKFKGFSDYYDWLLGMGEFDYSKFKAEWVLEYQTEFYLKKIFSDKNSRMAIKTFLRETKHSKISEYYLQYT